MSNTARQSHPSQAPEPRGGFRSSMTLRQYLFGASVYDVQVGRMESVLRRANPVVYTGIVLVDGNIHDVIGIAPAQETATDNKVAVVLARHGSQELVTRSLSLSTPVATIPNPA